MEMELSMASVKHSMVSVRHTQVSIRHTQVGVRHTWASDSHTERRADPGGVAGGTAGREEAVEGGARHGDGTVNVQLRLAPPAEGARHASCGLFRGPLCDLLLRIGRLVDWLIDLNSFVYNF